MFYRRRLGLCCTKTLFVGMFSLSTSRFFSNTTVDLILDRYRFQSNRVFDTLKKGILSAQTEVGKIDSLAELSVAIADNNFIKREALNVPTVSTSVTFRSLTFKTQCEPLLQFIISELRSLSYLRQFGLFTATVDDIDEDKVPIRSVKYPFSVIHYWLLPLS